MLCCGAVITAAVLEAAAKGAKIEELEGLAARVQNRVYNVNCMNSTSIRRAAAHGRVPKELGEKLKGVPDDEFCLPLGLIGKPSS
jgi:hypothetical protein